MFNIIEFTSQLNFTNVHYAIIFYSWLSALISFSSYPRERDFPSCSFPVQLNDAHSEIQTHRTKQISSLQQIIYHRKNFVAKWASENVQRKERQNKDHSECLRCSRRTFSPNHAIYLLLELQRFPEFCRNYFFET